MWRKTAKNLRKASDAANYKILRNATRGLVGVRCVCEPMEQRLLLSAALQLQPATSTNPTAVGGLQGEYFSGTAMNNAVVTRIDPAINFSWGNKAPVAGVKAGSFAVRWTGQITAPTTGKFTFYSSWVGGERLVVGGVTLVNKTKISKSGASLSKVVTLTAGKTYNVELDYFAAPKSDKVTLLWSGPALKKAAISTNHLVSGVSAPVAPTGITAESWSASTIDLSWQHNATATHYKIQRSQDGVNFQTVATPAASVTAFTDIGLPANTTFVYRVLSNNPVGDSAPSAPAIVATQPQGADRPSHVTATPISNSRVDLSWIETSISGIPASGFTIQRNDNNTGWQTITTLASGVTSFSDTAVAVGHAYAYQVIANSQPSGQSLTSGSSLPSDPATVILAPSAPTNLVANVVSAQSVSLAWTDLTNDEDGFSIQRSTAGGSYVTLATLNSTATTYTDSAIQNGTVYSYLVLATKNGILSAPTAVAPASIPLASPGNLTGSAAGDGMHLTWIDTTSTETHFLVRRATGSGPFADLAAVPVNTTTYTDGTYNPAAEYRYEVLAIGVGGSSNPSNLFGTLAAPTNLTAAAGAGPSVALHWTDNSGTETGYLIDRSTDGGATWNFLASVSTNVTTYTDTTALGMQAYNYRVRAATSSAVSAAAVAGVTVPLSAPTGVTAGGLTSTTIAVQWNDTNAAETGYEVDRSPNGTTGWVAITTTAPNSTNYTDANLAANSSYFYRVSTQTASSGTATSATVQATTAASDAPQYLLTPTIIASMRAKAQANTPQWQTFKNLLDTNLNLVNKGDYEGWELPALANYALGYQILKDSDPTTAANYADKAIAILNMGLQDDVRGSSASRMFLARGDGTTTQFTLPNTQINASTFELWSSAVSVQAVTKGAPNGQDDIETAQTFLKVSNTPDGNADYTKGTDWQFNPNYQDTNIDWSLGTSNQPAQGATYYVTMAYPFDDSLVNSGYTLSGNTVTFAQAPAANQAIYVEYQYNTPTLKYQQTGDGLGGFDNLMIDAGYTTRNLKYIAIGLDWLWDYQGLSSPMRSDAENLLVRWSDALKTPDWNSPNYMSGHYALRMATAIVLQNRDTTDAARLKSEMQTYHDTNIMPLMEAPTAGQGSADGGFWPEGWNYGTLSIQNIFTSDLAYANAGWGTVNTDKAWANELVTALLTEQPTQNTIYDAGAGYAYPLAMSSSNLVSEAGYMASDPTLKSNAMYAVTHGAGPLDSYWEDLLFNDPSAPATFGGNTLPVQYYSDGQGVAIARKDYNYNSTWLAFHSGNGSPSTAQGALEIDRGPDELLVNTGAVTGDQSVIDYSTFGNEVVIDDGGAGEQNYRYAEGVWYGTPGVTMPHFDGTPDYAYMQGNYAAAYNHDSGQPGTPNPATELVRDVFYVRGSDYVIVYDRAATTQPQYLKQVRWHFVSAPVVSGNSWSVTTGASTLFATTYSDVPLTTTSQVVNVYGTNIQQITTNNTSATSSVRYVTAMEVTGSGTVAADASTHVESGDGKVEGAQMGAYVVLFGRNGAVSGGTSYQFTAPSGQTTTHYLSDMTPGTTYTLTGANQTTATADAQGVLTFTSSGTGAAQTLTLS